MKKFVLILCLVLCFGVIAGCTGNKDPGGNTEEPKIVNPIQNGGSYDFN